MITKNDVQVCTPTIEEVLAYHTFENEIKNGYRSWVMPERIGTETFATFYLLGDDGTDEYGFTAKKYSETNGVEGHSPALKINRNSELFRCLELPRGLVAGEEFSLPDQKYDVPNSRYNGEKVIYRIELIQDDGVIIRPTKPIALDALFVRDENDVDVRKDYEICRKLEEDFVDKANVLIGRSKSLLRGIMQGFAVNLTSTPATARVYSFTADELLAICPADLSIAQQRQVIANANKLMDGKLLSRRS